MKTSDAGIAFIKSFEQLRLTPYEDQAGLYTIGFGHKMTPDEDHDTITENQANAIFLTDLVVAEDAVNQAVQVDISQHEFDGCCSLAFNIGSGNFTNSTLVKMLNAGQSIHNVAMQFLRWDYAADQASAGLLERRVAEKAIFEDGIYTNHV